MSFFRRKTNEAVKVKKSLNQILAGFNQTIEDLSALIERNRQEVAENEYQINILKAVSAELNSEASKAETVGAKLKDLIS